MLTPEEITELFYGEEGRPIAVRAKTSVFGLYVGNAIKAKSLGGKGTLIWVPGVLPEAFDSQEDV